MLAWRLSCQRGVRSTLRAGDQRGQTGLPLNGLAGAVAILSKRYEPFRFVAEEGDRAGRNAFDSGSDCAIQGSKGGRDECPHGRAEAHHGIAAQRDGNCWNFAHARGYAAIVEATPIKLSYVIYPGERFYDGQLVAIEDNRLVFRRETVLNDGRRTRSVEIKQLRPVPTINLMSATKSAPAGSPAADSEKTPEQPAAPKP